MQTKIKNILKEVKDLSPDDQMELLEHLVHQIRVKESHQQKIFDWKELYGLGQGLWQGEDAQDVVNRMREDRF